MSLTMIPEKLDQLEKFSYVQLKIQTQCHAGFVQKILCGFPNFSRKKLHIFKTFQGDFYLHIHQQNTLKSTFHDKIS